MPPRQQQPPHTLKEADKLAVARSLAKKPRQSKYEEVHIITMSCDPTPLDLAMFYIAIHNHILDVSAASINHNVAFEEPAGGYPEDFNPGIHDDVPVLSPHSVRFTYFIVEFTGRNGEPTLQFAVRHDNLYCCGFRALYPGDNPLKKKWYSFGPVSMMSSDVFPKVEKSNYPEGYNKCDQVTIYPGVF